jgi:hypothetical protein
MGVALLFRHGQWSTSSLKLRGPSSMGRPKPRRSASRLAATSDLNRLANPRVFHRSRDLLSGPVSYQRQMTTFFPFLRFTTVGNPLLVCLFLTPHAPFRKRRTTNRVYSSLHPHVQLTEFEAPGLSVTIAPRVGGDFLKPGPFVKRLDSHRQIRGRSLYVDVGFW